MGLSPLSKTSGTYTSASNDSTQDGTVICWGFDWKTLKKVAKGLAISGAVIICIGAIAASIFIGAAFATGALVAGGALVTCALITTVSSTSLGFLFLTVSGVTYSIGLIALKKKKKKKP